MQYIPETLLGVSLATILVGCFVNWFVTFRRGHPFISRRSWHGVPWGFGDLCLFAATVMLLVSVSDGIARSGWNIPTNAELADLPPRQQGVLFLAFGTATALTTALGFIWLRVRFPADRSQLGFDLRHLMSDIWLGAKWFTMLAAPVLFMQLIVTQLQPTQHPLMQMLIDSQDRTLLVIAAYAAMFAAPLFEETFFRLLLQGWLEKLQLALFRPDRLGRHSPESLLVGDVAPADSSGSEFSPDAAPVSDPLPAADRVLWWPIVASSALFAAAHLQNGPDWLPLFFLALGLGYLYQRTRRIQACIVVHVLINSLAVLQLWVEMRAAGAEPPLP